MRLCIVINVLLCFLVGTSSERGRPFFSQSVCVLKKNSLSLSLSACLSTLSLFCLSLLSLSVSLLSLSLSLSFICLSVCIFLSLFVCLSVCLSLCLSVCLSFSLSLLGYSCFSKIFAIFVSTWSHKVISLSCIWPTKTDVQVFEISTLFCCIRAESIERLHTTLWRTQLWRHKVA